MNKNKINRNTEQSDSKWDTLSDLSRAAQELEEIASDGHDQEISSSTDMEQTMDEDAHDGQKNVATYGENSDAEVHDGGEGAELENSNQPLTHEEIKELQEKWRKESEKRALEWADIIGKSEGSFSREVKRYDGDLSDKEFQVWEKDFETNYKYLRHEMEDAGLYRFTKENAEVELAVEGAVTPGATIEAYSGRYFTSRFVALRDAISKSGSKNAEKEIALLDSFEPKVMAHVDTKYGPTRTPEELSRRMARHNEIIVTLNEMNDLARKYGTTPFTVRNFFPCTYESQRGLTKSQEEIATFDRDVVEAYYTNAFLSQIRKAEREQAYYNNNGPYFSGD